MSWITVGAEELRAVVESDASVATQLLQTVAGYLTTLATRVNMVANPADVFPDVVQETVSAEDQRDD